MIQNQPDFDKETIPSTVFALHLKVFLVFHLYLPSVSSMFWISIYSSPKAVFNGKSRAFHPTPSNGRMSPECPQHEEMVNFLAEGMPKVEINRQYLSCMYNFIKLISLRIRRFVIKCYYKFICNCVFCFQLGTVYSVKWNTQELTIKTVWPL